MASVSNPSETKPPGSETSQSKFRRCLREADQYILNHQFDQAKTIIAEAKAIDPTNPYIKAFEDRIKLFEQKKDDFKSSELTAAGHVKFTDIPTTKTTKIDLTPANREMLEQKLRQQIEAEYKAKFMHEIKKAEVAVANSLEEERKKLELQRQSLKNQYELQIAETQKRLEQEYQQRLDEEIGNTEQRLKQQYQNEQAFIESEMKSRLTMNYEVKIRELEDRWKEDQSKLLEKEREAFKEREKLMQEQFERKLLESLRKTESMFREQNLQMQQIEKEKIRQELDNEFKSKLKHAHGEIQQEFNQEKTKLEQAFLIEKRKIQEENQNKLDEQLKLIRQREAEEFERKRVAALRDLEADLQGKYHTYINTERKRIQEEAEKAVEAEKKRLHTYYEAQLQEQNEKLQNIRTELRNEMEQNFLRRLEQVAKEFDHKMELLGTKIPQAVEEKKSLYRERMRNCYLSGQPTVNDAKILLELKELLELTFDEHLALESDIRLELYVENVENRILSGDLNLKSLDRLNELKQRFQIVPEEAARLEPYILSSFQRLALKGKILIVDDEPLLLRQFEDLLTSNGFQVVTADRITSALEKINSTSVDLILSDIKFPEGELDGFNFFQAVQKIPHMRKIPFIFMSSLHDGVIVRSGVQLGVDDYLTKPMDPDMLIAVIEGKLKRYRSLK